MTDKQIIDLTEIDKKYKDKCSLIKAGKCKNVNIFIEQSRKLKVKEQECEELKEKVKKYGEINEQETKDYAELKADNKHLNGLLNQALKELEQSREAIEKIKEIAEKNLNIHTCAFKGCGYDLITKQILQICDEVNQCESQ